MGKFGNISTIKRTIVIAVIEVVSQKIMEETDAKLTKANAKLLQNVADYKKRSK